MVIYGNLELCHATLELVGTRWNSLELQSWRPWNLGTSRKGPTQQHTATCNLVPLWTELLLEYATLEPCNILQPMQPWNCATLESCNPRSETLGMLEPCSARTLEPWQPRNLGTLEPCNLETRNPESLVSWNLTTMLWTLCNVGREWNRRTLYNLGTCCNPWVLKPCKPWKCKAA